MPVITGVGLLSTLGLDGPDALQSLVKGDLSSPDQRAFAPWSVFPAASYDVAQVLPSRSDRRQTAPWQRHGLAAAQMAFRSAGLDGDGATALRAECLAHVAANGGAREETVDNDILDAVLRAKDRDRRLNDCLTRMQRPSFMLAQLPNMLAGIIAMVHGTGAGSRTFTGEEMAGVEAVRLAVARLREDDPGRFLVGAVHDAERRDFILTEALGGRLHRGAPQPVFDRNRHGIVPGTAAAFMVIESVQAAHSRKAAPLAQIRGITSFSTDIGNGLAGSGERLLAGTPPDLVISAASGMHTRTAEENAAIRAIAPDTRVMASGDLIGHAYAAAFPAALVLAVMAIHRRLAGTVLVTCLAPNRGGAVAVVEGPA